MQLITINVTVTMDMVSLKLSDLDISMCTPDLVRTGKDQRLEFEILDSLWIMACRAGFYCGLSGNGLRILGFRMLAARAMAGFAPHIGEIRRVFYACKTASVVASGVAFVTFFQLMFFELGLHYGYGIP